MGTVLLPAVSVLISILITVLFFSKKRDLTKKTSKLYEVNLMANIIYSLFGTGMFLYGLAFENVGVMVFLEKIHMIMTLVMILLIGYYGLSSMELRRKIESSFLAVLIVLVGCFSGLTLFSSLNVGSAGNLIYGSGSAYTSVLICTVILLLFNVILASLGLTKSRKLNYVSSFIILALLFGIGLMIRGYVKDLVFENFVITFVLLVIYMTVESPYIKEVNKLKEEVSEVEGKNQQLVTNMSKELRMPLNSIVGLTEDIVNYRDKLPKEVVEDVNDISRASKSLKEVIDKVLGEETVEKVEKEEAYNFVEEVTGYLRDFEIKNNKPNVIFSFDLDENIPYELLGNGKTIKSVIDNVLTLAYDDCSQGVVDFSAKAVKTYSGCDLVITIQTTSRTKDINLDFARSHVDDMNGSVIFSSMEEGLMIVVSVPQKLSNMAKFMLEKNDNRPVSANNFGVSRILIVDDNALNIKVATKAIQDFGFEIESCESGKECLEKINSGCCYDLILMDIMMPEMGGEETFSKLKEIEGFNTPVLALTADAEVGAKNKYVSLGFIDYIAKPFNREQIKSRLDLIFGKSKDEEMLSDMQKINDGVEVSKSDIVMEVEKATLIDEPVVEEVILEEEVEEVTKVEDIEEISLIEPMPLKAPSELEDIEENEVETL